MDGVGKLHMQPALTRGRWIMAVHLAIPIDEHKRFSGVIYPLCLPLPPVSEASAEVRPLLPSVAATGRARPLLGLSLLCSHYGKE